MGHIQINSNEILRLLTSREVRAVARVDADGVLALTTMHRTTINTTNYTRAEAQALVRAIEDALIEPLTTYAVEWDRE